MATLTTPDDVAEDAIALARRWLDEAKGAKEHPTARLLADVLGEPDGLAFTLGFVDRVVRPEDVIVAGRNLFQLSRSVPRSLPWYYILAIQVGGFFALGIPWIVVPIARYALRRMVGHLVIDADPKSLGKHLQALRANGNRLNINLLGEAVLGDKEAARRRDGIAALLARSDVEYVSVKVSAVASQLSMWAFEETVERIVTELLPLYRQAARGSGKFVNLDMEEYRDLDLTVAVFERLMSEPDLADLEAGIVLQAYLPDALAALDRLTAFALRRRAAGGAGIKIRIVKGANLAMEQVDAVMHGWPQAPWPSKVQTDANYKRMLDTALVPERTDAVRIGIAGHNLFDVALAHLLAERRGVSSRVEFEMLLGMATGQAEAVSRDVGQIRLYTPVVPADEFDSAISYLIRRLEENASSENFMSAIFELADDDALFRREERRFLAALEVLAEGGTPSPRRTQDRTAPIESRGLPRAFNNEPDSDPALAVNRAWGRAILDRIDASEAGVATLAASRIDSLATIEALFPFLASRQATWSGLEPARRAAVLARAGDELAAYRGALIEVMGSETGKTIAEADTEVSEAVDFARYYALSSLELHDVPGASFEPAGITLVAPPWNFPVAIPAGSVLAALASGSSVILKPAPQARRCAAVLCEALWAAGVPRDVLALVDVDEGDLGRALVAHPSVDRVILTGAWQTARLFRSWRPDLPLLAETSGKNAIIVTPSADYDLAVQDIVRSAFGHAGQKCSAASLVIMVGSVARSDRFRHQLLDAVRSLRVGYPSDPTVTMGPVIEEPSDKLREGLTKLGLDEAWLLKPRELDDSGRLWSPGVRGGVKPGSAFHLTEYFGPVLGLMSARTLDEAIGIQNATSYGLTAGLHSLDPEEVALWLDHVQAGNLYVNRGITGAIVRRQPFGGWKRSAVGPGAKAGGPNYLATLGRWTPVPTEATGVLSLTGISDEVAELISAAAPHVAYEAYDLLRTAALDDEANWQREFGVARDVSGLELERNVFRYRPVETVVRLAEGGNVVEFLRVLLAARRARSRVELSSAVELSPDLAAAILASLPGRTGQVVIESDAEFLSRVTAGGVGERRLRLVGGDASVLAHQLGGATEPTVYANPVTTSGRVELLPFLHEQAVSITAHRFGNPDLAMAGLVL